MFGIAYFKLLWANRLANKQEDRDDERGIAFRESGQCTQAAEARKSQDIPFGIRAVQSGIQVDGIWISKDSVLIPASINLGHMVNGSFDRRQNQNLGLRVSLDNIQVAVHPTAQPGTVRRQDESRTLLAGWCSKSAVGQEFRGHRPAYKPRRSSQLRYDSYEGRKETGDKVEGKPRETAEKRVQKSDDIPDLENDALSDAAADIEHHSGSDTDVTLSCNSVVRMNDQRELFSSLSPGGKKLLGSTGVASGTPPPPSLLLPHSKDQFQPLLLGHSGDEKLDTFAAAMANPMDNVLPFKLPYARTARDLATSGELRAPLLFNCEYPSPFIPGELHMNKSVRKVNSGFEILPAGTFGTTTELNGGGIKGDETEQNRKSNKLQKKTRL